MALISDIYGLHCAYHPASGIPSPVSWRINGQSLQDINPPSPNFDARQKKCGQLWNKWDIWRTRWVSSPSTASLCGFKSKLCLFVLLSLSTRLPEETYWCILVLKVGNGEWSTMRTIPFPHSLGTTFLAGGPIRSSGLQVLSRMLSFGRMGIVLTTQGTLREPFVSFSTMTIVYCGNIIRYIMIYL